MKTVVGIFAHPDDEALGPGGTLATLAKDNPVYLICVTNGDAGGKTSAEKEKIGNLRKEELKHSASVLGIKEVFFLGHRDGELCNNIYHKLAGEIQEKLEELRPEVIMTFEPNGVSGHIDHVAVSMISSYLYEHLKYIKKIMYYCLLCERAKLMKDYFIYFPDGYEKDQVQETINVKPVWDKKVKAMHCHKSQTHDVRTVLSQIKNFPKEEYFLIKTKGNNTSRV